MGCHTWYSVPVKTDKKQIIELAKKYLADNPYFTEDYRKMYQYAIDNELADVVCELAACIDDDKALSGEGWVLYKDERQHVVDEHNKTVVDMGDELSPYDFDEIARRGLEWCGDNPRIGGYPDKVIRSYDELVEFMETGYHGTRRNDKGEEEPHHYQFREMEKDQHERVMSNIKRFFKTYPKGIITFG